MQRSHTEVHKVGPCSHRQLSRGFYHLLNRILQQLPMSHLRIWTEFLATTFLGKACQCLVVSQSLVIPLLGSMEAESSWILPTSGTAHKSAWHKDVFVSHFLQSYLRCDEIRTLFLPKLCKITSGMKTVWQSISVAGRTDFIINKI